MAQVSQSLEISSPTGHLPYNKPGTKQVSIPSPKVHSPWRNRLLPMTGKAAGLAKLRILSEFSTFPCKSLKVRLCTISVILTKLGTLWRLPSTVMLGRLFWGLLGPCFLWASEHRNETLNWDCLSGSMNLTKSLHPSKSLLPSSRHTHIRSQLVTQGCIRVQGKWPRDL